MADEDTFLDKMFDAMKETVTGTGGKDSDVDKDSDNKDSDDKDSEGFGNLDPTQLGQKFIERLGFGGNDDVDEKGSADSTKDEKPDNSTHWSRRKIGRK